MKTALLVLIITGAAAVDARADDTADPASLAVAACHAKPPENLVGPDALTAAKANTETKRKALSVADAAVAAAGDPKAIQAAQGGQVTARAALDTALKAEQKARVVDAQEYAAAHRRLCAAGLKPLAGKDYPLGFVEQVDPMLCADLGFDSDTRASGEAICADVQKVSGFTTSAVSLVQGLGDLLQAEAKAEILQYFIEHLATTFCRHKLDGEVLLSTWFVETCTLLLPADKPADPDSFELQNLKTAFFDDLKALPGHLAAYLEPKIKARWNNAPIYAGVVIGIVEVVIGLVGQKKPIEIFDQLDDQAEGQATGIVGCDFAGNLADERKVCLGLLALQIARRGADAYAGPTERANASKILQDAYTAFCAAHSKSAHSDKGTCVTQASVYATWHPLLLGVYRAAEKLIDLQASVDALRKTATPAEVGKRLAPEIVDGLRALMHAVRDILDQGEPASKTSIDEDFALVDLVLDGYKAVAGDDPTALRAAVLGVLGSPVLAKTKLPTKMIRAITIVTSLGTAKDRAEVKGILEDAASPVGTYKMKYDADHMVIAINGFVGFFAGVEALQDNVAPDGGAALAAHRFAPLAFRTPVGLDFTPACTSSHKWHLGLAVTVIDPLALDVSTADDTVSAAWKTLVEPSAYLRLGIYGTPFVLGVGGGYSFARRSPDMCTTGGGRCFDGAWQAGVFLSADVPLFILH